MGDSFAKARTEPIKKRLIFYLWATGVVVLVDEATAATAAAVTATPAAIVPAPTPAMVPIPALAPALAAPAAAAAAAAWKGIANDKVNKTAMPITYFLNFRITNLLKIG